MEIDIVSMLLWGFAATVVLTTIEACSQGLGWSRMSIPFMLGTMFTPDRLRAYVLGSGVHMINGWIFSFIYILTFESWGRATWWLGGGIGFVHGLFVLVVLMPVLPGMHSRMASSHRGPTPTRLLEPPGFLALNYGRHTPLTAMLAHVVYGAMLGAFYHVV